MNFNDRDLSQIKKKGINPEKVKQQIDIFKRGNVHVNIVEAATLRNGILSISEEEKRELIGLYDRQKDDLSILKFIPASGAATRMFKALYNFLKEYKPENESIEEYVGRKNHPKLEMFFSRMKDLPFHEKIHVILKEKYSDFSTFSEDRQQYLFVKTMLEEDGLNFGNLPKGLVPFHKYEDHLTTAFEEHLIEAVDYAASGRKVKVHFTVAPEHREKFEAEAKAVVPRLQQETGYSFEISYSYQDPKTDTVAVNHENEPFRDGNGDIFFRPGGHGALIGNLNSREEDLIFIKNIDNVVIPKYRVLLTDQKKLLAGKLLRLQEKTFSYLKRLDSGANSEELSEMADFLQNSLNSAGSVNFDEFSEEEESEILRKYLDRPIRVCGMVKNEGEPGGGPFWVKNAEGEISLQIVESSQIDHENYQQSKIANEATHFNPVDIVCSFKDYKAGKFDLHDFVDEKASFIANKTKDGKELKALELPGLWNGGMAGWISIFVEVPAETFNPVKTVADLLKPSHQVR